MPASSAANAPPNATYWGSFDEAEMDTLAGYEFQYLPPGVGLQTINDPDPTNTNTAHDRYLRRGLILFGGSGQLLHQRYTITYPASDPDETRLYRVMAFDKRAIPPSPANSNITDVGALPAYPLYSQLGVVLYDEETFRTTHITTSPEPDEDPTNDNVAYNAGAYNEIAEEQWLDGYAPPGAPDSPNVLSLMINRYNGTLVRGE
jgi:hypothetical protein